MSTKVKSTKATKSVKSTKTNKAATAKEKTSNRKSAGLAKVEATAKELEGYTKNNPGLLIDRHGEDCGYVLYSPYFLEKTILSLNDDAPRLITLETWERWGKQAKAFEKAAKKVTKGLDSLSSGLEGSVTKYKAKTKPIKKAKVKKSDKKGK